MTLTGITAGKKVEKESITFKVKGEKIQKKITDPKQAKGKEKESCFRWNKELAQIAR